MRYDTALTYAGALQILGRHETKRIERLSKILGGLSLAAGVTLAVTAGATPAAAVALAAVWGWIDQKNEAMGLLRDLVGAVQDRIGGVRGHERHQLVIAAHTVLAASAYFEVLGESLGKKQSARNALSKEDRQRLIGAQGTAAVFTSLYTAKVPAPSATRGFEANVAEIEDWYRSLVDRTQTFLDGLADPVRLRRSLADEATTRYRSRYLEMAAAVTEFRVWAMLTESAAAASRLDTIENQLRGLVRVEQLLTEMAPRGPADSELAGRLHQVNRRLLSEPIVPAHAERYGTAVTFPTIEDAFIDPNYRVMPDDPDTRPADDIWWRDLPVRSDLSTLLTAYVTSADGVAAPMLLLGHPGAGKSLLTKVLAGRFPPTAYTIVRVPLRAVSANLRVHDQIQDALDLSTHGRISWSRLSDEADATIRVVLLDGLDELLQATTDDRSGYLHDVAEFQRREAAVERPVFVIVTSRTLLADRVDIPPGTVVAKLEDFDDPQIAAWLESWRQANAKAIARGSVREVTVQDVSSQQHLAQQPLLLLMLTLYSADPAAPSLDANLSAARLYRRLLDNFIRRELSKQDGTSRAAPADARIAEQLRQLGVAAFAMFQRGRLNVNDLELAADAIALRMADVQVERPEEIAFRIVGRFLFVHADEAQVRKGAPIQRAYQFMHATFGEYLIAQQTIVMLDDIVLAAGLGMQREPDDSLLFTMLAHRPLASRASILDFAAQIFRELPTDQQDSMLRILEGLLLRSRRRSIPDVYPQYGPTPLDHVRRLAAYSANLVLLRVALAGPKNPALDIASLWPAEDDMASWRSTVRLWEAGLGHIGLGSVLAFIGRDGTHILPVHQFRDLSPDLLSVRAARLIGDDVVETQLRYGIALRDGYFYYMPGDPWFEVTASSLIPAITLPEHPLNLYDLPPPVGEGSAQDLRRAARLIALFIKTRAPGISGRVAWECAEWLRAARKFVPIDVVALAILVGEFPELLGSMAWLRDPRSYGGNWLAHQILHAHRDHDPGLRNLLSDIGEDSVNIDVRDGIVATLNAARHEAGNVDRTEHECQLPLDIDDSATPPS